MKAVASLILFLTWSLPVTGMNLDVLIVQGLSGEPRFSLAFTEQTQVIEEAAATLPRVNAISVLTGGAATRDGVMTQLSEFASREREDALLLVYLIGHGSWDDVDYKFNLPGPDLTAADLSAALTQYSGRLVLVNTSSASGASIDSLAAPGRLLMTATRSGNERHATRFGEHFSEALKSQGADTNKDRMISAAEAFRFASEQVAGYYEGQNQLATEHARLEGDDAALITLARLDTQPGTTARQSAAAAAAIAARDDIRERIEALRLNQNELTPADYQQRLRQLLLELALAEDAISRAEAEGVQ